MKKVQLEGTHQFYAEVGKRIAKYRYSQYTQQELASKTGLTRTSVVNIEKGRQQVFFHTIVEIAKVLHVPVNDLIPETDTLENHLRDKTQKGLDWVRTSTAVENLEGGKHHGSSEEAH